MKTKLTLPPYTEKEERWNSVSHWLGVLFSVAAWMAVAFMIQQGKDRIVVSSVAIYIATMTIVFCASALYHGIRHIKTKKVFRVIDHCSIYLLIAGTYTPITIGALLFQDPAAAWLIFAVVWISALVGIVLNAMDMNRFRVISMFLYVAMGWCVVMRFGETVRAIGADAMLFIFVGGVVYTLGAIIYTLGKRNNTPYVHFVFHLFVLLAAVLQYIGVLHGVLS